MRKLLAGAATLATIAAVSGCTSLPPPAPATDITAARQNVRIYEAPPPFSTPIDQITASSCGGSREDATDTLLATTLQRGGNGIVDLACRSEGISFSCWSTAICTATAVRVAPPPPPPPPPPPRRDKRKHKPKPKPKQT